MKLLELYKHMLGDMKVLPSFREMVINKRTEYNNDLKFCNHLINCLGSKDYNNFLDYSLLAIKLNHMLKHMRGVPDILWFGEDEDEGLIKEVINDLLYDDRHDLYQNMPYILEDIYTKIKDGPEKDVFWKCIVNIIIECINVHGTGDVSTSYSVKE